MERYYYKNNDMKPIRSLQEKKQDLYKNLLLVALLSTGISLCANYLSAYKSPKWILWAGIVCIFVVFIAYIISFYKSKSFVIKTDSLFITNKQGVLVPIKRYRMAENMSSYLNSVFSENKAYEKMWTGAFTKDSKLTNVDDKKIVDFVGELIEYTFIEWFSTQLKDYFKSIESQELEILTRENISDYILNNRILEMISKPYEDREKFSEYSDTLTEKGKIGMIYYNGTIYHNFKLKLPKRSSLYRKDGFLYIKNPNYSLKFSHNFEGLTTFTPRLFENLYLNENMCELSIYKFRPTIEIKLNPIYFLLGKNWKYMNWIDIIGEKFSEYFSSEHFF